MLADSLDTLSRGSSSFHCNHSANTRASAARTAANMQPPFVERLLFLHTLRPNCISSRRQSMKSFPDSLANLKRIVSKTALSFCEAKLPGAYSDVCCARSARRRPMGPLLARSKLHAAPDKGIEVQLSFDGHTTRHERQQQSRNFTNT